MRPDWLTPPNLLSFARILMTPVIGWTIVERNWALALPLLFFTGISDAIDGLLARRFGWQSELGAKLDPIADKLLLACVYVALGYAGELPWWLVALVFSRDLLILLFAVYALARTRIRSFPPSVWGKLSTAFQMLLAGACTLRRALPEHALASWVEPIQWVAAALTVWSALHYGWRAAVLLRKPD